MIKIRRLVAVAVAFIIVCSSFLVVLAVNQAKGPSKEISASDVRTETVFATRGRIFDRNGVLLVDNSKKYNFIFEYGTMAYTPDGMNSALLECIKLLSDTGNADKRTEERFPLIGSYPEVSFADGYSDASSSIGYYFNKFCVENKLKTDISATELAEYMVKKYSLGKYSNEQITELLHIRYDMWRNDFGAYIGNNKYQEYIIATDFDTSKKNEMSLIAQLGEREIEGANMARQDGRVYTYPGYASHLLGTVGAITEENVEKYPDYDLDTLVGIDGVEAAFEEILHGVDGVLHHEYDSNGVLIREYYDPEPIIGNDIYLTIDINLQIAAEDSLATEIDRLEHAEAGAATAVDTQSGEVLVLASNPTYDISQYFRAISGTYAPGSTYKVGSALAGLERGYITSSTSYLCNHKYPYYHNPTCLGTHGATTVTDAIRESCNIFFYYLGDEMGLEQITNYTKSLGLGVPTGIELDEAVGSISSALYCEEHDLAFREVDNVTGAIGQSYHTYTPLQLSVYMSSVVNHGNRYSAHILRQVKTRAGETVFTKKPELAEQTSFSDSTYNILIEAMGEVVSSSVLSSYFASSGVEVGGKTGTAETGAAQDNALFSGFAPLNSPKIAATCVIEKGEAGNNAAKIVAAIFEAYFNPPKEEIQ